MARAAARTVTKKAVDLDMISSLRAKAFTVPALPPCGVKKFIERRTRR
jgi:hypothetical protein